MGVGMNNEFVVKVKIKWWAKPLLWVAATTPVCRVILINVVLKYGFSYE
jgi:hypothetical protein